VNDNKKNLVDTFLKIYNFKISLDVLKSLKAIYNTKLLEILIKFKECRGSLSIQESYDLLSIQELVILYDSVLHERNKREIFSYLDSHERIRLFLNFIKEFDSDEKMPLHDGFQSQYDHTASFVRRELIEILQVEELEKILRENISDYWEKIIKWKIADNPKKKMNIDKNEVKKLKKFIFSKGLINKFVAQAVVESGQDVQSDFVESVGDWIERGGGLYRPKCLLIQESVSR
jgi:hypothetical protein